MTDNAIIPFESNKTLTIPAIPTESEVRSLALIADYAARSNFLRSTAPRTAHDQRQADAFLVIMYGRELGIPPMTALKMIFVLDGQPSASTQAIVGLARRRGVEVDIPDPSTVTDSATVRIKRPGGEWKSYTFTLDMAKKMGLAGKKNWTGMPSVMLIWRAAGMGMRFEVPDYTGGLYPVEELAPDTIVNEDGEPVGQIVISKPEPEEQKPEPKWHHTERNLHELSERSFTAGYITERNGKGVAELVTMIAPKTWDDFADRNAAGLAIKEIGEAAKAAKAAAKVKPPEPANSNGSPFDASKPQVNPHTGEVEAPLTNAQIDAQARAIANGMAVHAGTPEKDDGKVIPTEDDANMEYERALERNP